MGETWCVSWNSAQLTDPHFSTRISHISWSLCVKFCARYLNMLPLHTCEFRANRYRESLRSLRAYTKFCPVLCIFHPIWKKFDARHIHRSAVSGSWELRIGRAENITKWIWLLPFHIHCPICVQFGVRNLQKVLFKICKWKSEQGRICRCWCVVLSSCRHAITRSVTCILAYSCRAKFVWSFQDLHLKLSINNIHFSYGSFEILSIYYRISSYFQRSQFLIKIIHLNIPQTFKLTFTIVHSSTEAYN